MSPILWGVGAVVGWFLLTRDDEPTRAKPRPATGTGGGIVGDRLKGAQRFAAKGGASQAGLEDYDVAGAINVGAPGHVAIFPVVKREFNPTTQSKRGSAAYYAQQAYDAGWNVFASSNLSEWPPTAHLAWVAPGSTPGAGFTLIASQPA